MQEQGDYMTKSHFSVNPKMKDWSKAERDAYILHGKEPEQKRTLWETWTWDQQKHCHEGCTPSWDLPPEREYEWLCSVRTKVHYLDFTQAFCIFDADFRDTFYDESRSHAHRTINPENVITNKQMNFSVSTPVIWTRPVVHVFSILQMSGRSCQWD